MKDYSKRHLFNTFQNKDDVFIRCVIVGLISVLDEKLSWYNVINNNKDLVKVPCYFTIAGSERFLTTFYNNQYDLETSEITETIHEKIPRMHISLDSVSIQEEFLANKHNRYSYIREDECGEVKQYNSEVQEIPIKLDINSTLFVDSIVDLFKSYESILNTFYKNLHFYVDYKGIKIPCTCSIQDSITKERSTEFNYGDNKDLKQTFSFEVMCTYPLIFRNTEFFEGDRITNIDTKLDISNATTNKNSRNEYNEDNGIWVDKNNNSNFYK